MHHFTSGLCTLHTARSGSALIHGKPCLSYEILLKDNKITDPMERECSRQSFRCASPTPESSLCPVPVPYSFFPEVWQCHPLGSQLCKINLSVTSREQNVLLEFCRVKGHFFTFPPRETQRQRLYGGQGSFPMWPRRTQMMLPSTPPQRMHAKWEASAQNKHSCYQREASFPFIQVFRMN